MSGSPFDDAFAHHAWATLRLIDTCIPLTPDQLDAAVPGTYGSILDTMSHPTSRGIGPQSVGGL